jgi:quercetin dioxygenase-like cupin family protein
MHDHVDVAADVCLGDSLRTKVRTTKREGSMRTRKVLTFAMSFVLATVVLGASELVTMPSADLKWTDLDPAGAPGVKVADLWGDQTKGAFGAYFKLPAGFAVPLHTHTHDMKVIFVSGTYIQVPEGKPEFRLGPGSYMMQPGGNYRHATSCDKTSECVFFVESEGAFDLQLVETGKAPATK